MEKTQILNEYKKQDDKILLAKVLDKIEFCKIKNRIEYTDFLDMYQLGLIKGFLDKLQISNYMFYGGYDNAERKILIIYPEEYTSQMIEKNYGKIFKVIRVKLPDDLEEKYSHRDYLGGIIKLGVVREKIGDILVSQSGSDIICIDEIDKFLLQNLNSLTRFGTSKISSENINDLKITETKKKEIKIIVASLRLDNFVSELARCSRNKAVEIINTERVFVNYQNETKKTKQIKEGDTITIRGKGRFVIKQLAGNTRSGRFIISVEKFV